MRRWKVGLAAIGLAAALGLLWAQPPPPQPPGPGGPGGPPGGFEQFRQRMEEGLKRAGLTDQELEKVRETTKLRFEALRPVAEARRDLFQLLTADASAFTDQAARAAVQKYRSALSTALSRLAQLDKELDKAVRYSQRPKVEAALLAIGAIGQPVGGGFGGGMGFRRGGGFGAGARIPSGRRTQGQSL
ncbi:MAG: hypothetical protein NZ959_03995 [Armatimonadetes bacterium]|nr:hypothetical protein [Armatimonadota bacterium]MDW8122575.1 hypothetical protein [Armatimonadota bacterium]